MANHASAVKRNRQRLTRTLRNRAARSALRSALKEARSALLTGSAEAVAKAQIAKIALAKAAGKGIIHANNAARRTSRLDHALAKLQG